MSNEIVTHEWFKALADPIRQQIVEILAEDPATVSALVSNFEVSRPSISRHLRVLREGGLVEETPSGRERVYRLRPEALEKASNWLRSMSRAGLVADLSVAVDAHEEPEVEGAEWRQW